MEYSYFLALKNNSCEKGCHMPTDLTLWMVKHNLVTACPDPCGYSQMSVHFGHCLYTECTYTSFE
jgi:hypothetical protein